jgi:DNA-binding NtrC family response regulator
MSDILLIVDDERGVTGALARALADEAYEVLVADSAKQALELLETRGAGIRVVLSDEMMPEMTGSEFLGIVRERWPDTIRMLLTGHASVGAIMAAVNSGEIFRFFVKPWDDTELRLALRQAFERSALEAENRRLMRTVKRQAAELRLLEASHPGIATLQRDTAGRLIVQEVSEDEIAEILRG